MPFLQYKCPVCGKEFDELVKKFDDTVLCPACGGKAERCYSGKIFTQTGKTAVKCTSNCKTCSGCK